MHTRLYVGNLTVTTTARAVRELFTEAGTVTACELIRDHPSGRLTGFAHVTMSSYAEAEEATRLFNAYALDDRILTVKAAKTRAERRSYAERPMARTSGRRE